MGTGVLQPNGVDAGSIVAEALFLTEIALWCSSIIMCAVNSSLIHCRGVHQS